jgi:polyisoprenoid-binding protein YceI
MKTFTSIVAALTLSATALLAGNYQVDASHTDVGFKVKHMMVSNVKGSFSDVSGSFVYDEKARTLSKLSGVVKTASVDTRNEKRDQHLRAKDFFDAEKYPELTFELLSHKGDTVVANVSMHGITKKITFEAEMGGDVQDPWGNHRAGFTLEGSLNRKDFGLTWNKVLDAGGLAVGDKIKLIIEVEGVEK